MKTYIYKGTEDGIPGLPHEITDEQAQALGVSDLLTAAIKNGSYIEKKAATEKVTIKKELSNG